MFRRDNKIIHNWAQIISPCSKWLARCHVTIQRCSAAPAPIIIIIIIIIIMYYVYKLDNMN